MRIEPVPERKQSRRIVTGTVFNYIVGIGQQLLLIFQPRDNALPLDDRGIITDLGLGHEGEGIKDGARHVGLLLVCGYSPKPIYSRRSTSRAGKGNNHAGNLNCLSPKAELKAVID